MSIYYTLGICVFFIVNNLGEISGQIPQITEQILDRCVITGSAERRPSRDAPLDVRKVSTRTFAYM